MQGIKSKKNAGKNVSIQQLLHLVSLSSPVHVLQCQGHAACYSNGGKLVVNYQRTWGHKNMDFSHIK